MESENGNLPAASIRLWFNRFIKTAYILARDEKAEIQNFLIASLAGFKADIFYTGVISIESPNSFWMGLTES